MLTVLTTRNKTHRKRQRERHTQTARQSNPTVTTRDGNIDGDDYWFMTTCAPRQDLRDEIERHRTKERKDRDVHIRVEIEIGIGIGDFGIGD